MPDPGQGAKEAVALAARLGEVGFASFTSDLVISVFNALVDAHTEQTRQFVDLMGSVSASLADYVEATADDVSPSEVAALLAALGLDADGTGVTSGNVDAVNDALEVPAPAGAGAAGNNRVAVAGATSGDPVVDAVARRIAANRYDFLREMVRMGVLRVVVDHGLVETRLVFRTRGRTERGRSESSSERETLNAGLAALGAGLFMSGGSAGTSGGGFGLVGMYGARNDLAVRTTSSYDRDVTGSKVQIYGGVEIHFKTDYQPLAE